MRNEILIPSVVAPNAYYLGPMGDPDPSDFINQETNRIPFKQSVVYLSSWNTKTPFKNWSKITKGWRDWFRRVSEKKIGDWKIYDLNQCQTLSDILGQFQKKVLVFQEDKSTIDCLKSIRLVS